MKRIFWILAIPLTGIGAGTWGQLAPPAVSIDETMKFIQGKLLGEDKFGYVTTKSSVPGVASRSHFSRSEVFADAATCSLHTVTAHDNRIEVEAGATYAPGGKVVTGDDLHNRELSTGTVFFKDVESVSVETMQDRVNHSIAKDGHPEVTVTIMPPVFVVVLSASKPVFSFHRTVTQGSRPPKDDDHLNKEIGYSFYDENIANRVSNAMTHAVELCGGGNKDPF